jgi:DNA-binding response OmpR family regulator
MTYRAEVVDEVLIVEDDPSIGRSLTRTLTNVGYSCTLARSVREAQAIDNTPDLVLLDLGLPDGDGLDLARELRAEWPELPIIMLTARDEELDVVIGLDAGAIDYVTKPFRLAELLARIRAQLRQPDYLAGQRVITDGDVVVQIDARRVLLRGAEIAIRAREFDLLVELLNNRGVVVTREDLMSRIWDEYWSGSTKTLDAHVASLRRRLGEAAGQPSRITALRGVGYRWEPAVGTS